MVPGITGSALRDRITGEVMWGRGRNAIMPRDGGYSMARSIDESVPVRLEAFDVIDKLSLFGVFKKKVYGPIFDLFDEAGFDRGALRSPEPGRTVYTFAYDWRLDVVDSAREFSRGLDRLRRMRGEDVLEIDLLCQSTGATLCRYFLKYGNSTLSEAESGSTGGRESVEVRTLILVGSAHGGSLRNLSMLHRGRTYVQPIGRVSHPETMFTFRSLFQELPFYRDDLFLDGSGKPLEIDLFDPDNWLEYGWSIFSDEAEDRIVGHEQLFGDRDSRTAYLKVMLDRARRLHELLSADAPAFQLGELHSVQNSATETSERAVVEKVGGVWRTSFFDDEHVAGRPFVSSMSVSGDGHATVASQEFLSPQEREAHVDTLYVPGGHFTIILSDETRDALVDILDLPPRLRVN